jgi:flagellar basal body-associated protein FliL
LVHYESELTSIPQPTVSEVAKTGKLLLNIIVFVIIASLAAILLGFFLGGGRALYRIARGKPVSSVYDEEFIRLNLQD